MSTTDDMVNQPQHYRGHPSGVECIQITEHMPFCAGNSAKYVFRRLDKWNTLEDAKKAVWYLRRHIASGISSVWLHESGVQGRLHLARVIDNEEPGYVRDFYDSLYFDVPEAALTALLLEVERLEAAGDGSQSG